MKLFISIITALIVKFIVFVSVADSLCVLSNGTVVPVHDYEICCGRQIHEKYVNGLERGCCSGTDYIRESKMCCGNELISFEGENIDDYDCCGTTPYKTDEGECCNDKLLQSHEICCGDRPHRYIDGGICCGNFFFNNYSTHYCFEKQKVIPIGTSLCNGQQYDVDTDICCDDTDLHRNISNIGKFECCGTHLTNTDIEECEWGPVPRNIPIKTMPCGQGFYYTSRQRCCRGRVMNITSSSQQCCGLTLYDTEKEEQCCHSVEKLYLSSKYKCCGSSVDTGALASLDQDEDCCGPEKYDTKTFVCCQLDDVKYVINKSQTHHDRCCPNSVKGRSKSYFSKWQTCSIMPGEEPRILKKTAHCGTRPINDSTDLCCNTELYTGKKSEGFQCCDQGFRIFYPSSQICCNSVVFNITEKPSCHHQTIDNGFTLPEDQTPVIIGEQHQQRSVTPSSPTSKLCNWCNIGIDTAIQLVKSHKITICKQRAVKLKKLFWSSGEEGTVIEGKIDKDIYDVGFTRKRKQKLVIPCKCHIKTKNMLVITNKHLRGGVKHLDDQDLVLPFSGTLKRLLTSLCPLDVINNIREDIGYLLHKINRVKNRLLGYKS